ncbi:hypothetical protein RintRC_6791 [Richelia intracellularis]|nr:hypothetical protein RintRC_6791 [Richelia intracellularis]
MAQTLGVGWDLRGFTTTNIGDWIRERVNQMELWRGGRVFFPLERAVVMVLLTVERKGYFNTHSY